MSAIIAAPDSSFGGEVTSPLMTIKALAFDTGGTILDWHRGISGAFAAAARLRRRYVVASSTPLNTDRKSVV
jgi:hypothetical protein